MPTVVFRFATVLEPSELLDAEGIPRNWSVANARQKLLALPDPSPAAREALRQLEAAWKAGTRLLLRRCPDGRSCKHEWGDVRDIAKGLTLALDAEAAGGGEAFTVGGLLTVWEELVPALAERLGATYADVRMPSPSYFEFDHTKAREFPRLHARSRLLEHAGRGSGHPCRPRDRRGPHGRAIRRGLDRPLRYGSAVRATDGWKRSTDISGKLPRHAADRSAPSSPGPLRALFV